jgi:cell division protease FtsH
MALESDEGEVFLGRDLFRPQPHYSADTGNRIDRKVRELACQSLERAIAILGPRRELMDQLVDRLIAEETIDGESFRQSVAAWETSHPELAVAGQTLPAARLAVPVGET